MPKLVGMLPVRLVGVVLLRWLGNGETLPWKEMLRWKSGACIKEGLEKKTGPSDTGVSQTCCQVGEAFIGDSPGTGSGKGASMLGVSTLASPRLTTLPFSGSSS